MGNAATLLAGNHADRSTELRLFSQRVDDALNAIEKLQTEAV